MTAYEMRISDWSSDVCSSDLPGRGAAAGAVPGVRARPGFAADRDLGAAAGGVRLHRPGLRRGGVGGAHFRLRVRDRVRAAGAPRLRAAAVEAAGLLREFQSTHYQTTHHISLHPPQHGLIAVRPAGKWTQDWG